MKVFLNLLQWLLGLQKSSWHFYTRKKWLCVMKASKHEPKLKTVDNDNLLCITTLVQIRVGTSGEISGSRNLQLGSTQHYCMLGRAANDPSVSTITEKAPTRAFSWLKAPTSAFTFKTLLLRHVTMLNRHPNTLGRIDQKLGSLHNYQNWWL